MEVYAPDDDGRGRFEVVLNPQEMAECQEYGVLPCRSGLVTVADGFMIRFHISRGMGILRPTEEIVGGCSSLMVRGNWLSLPTILVFKLQEAKRQRAGGGLFYSLPLTGIGLIPCF